MDADVLERLADAHRRGAALMAITAGDDELTSMTDESVTVGPWRTEDVGSDDFEIATHVVSVSAGTLQRRRWRKSRVESL